jgi:hypothetical protein
MTSLALDYSPPRKAKPVTPPHTKSSSRNCFSSFVTRKQILHLQSCGIIHLYYTLPSYPPRIYYYIWTKGECHQGVFLQFQHNSFPRCCDITRPIETGEKELVQRCRVESQRCELPQSNQLRSPNCTCISRKAREYRWELLCSTI